MKRTLLQLLVTAGMAALGANAEIVYNSIPDPLPPNSWSEGFQCCSTAELGNIVTPAFSGDAFLSASIVLSNWAYMSEWAAGWGPVTSPDTSGFTVPITLNIYSVGDNGAVGTKLGSVTQDTLVAWRPEPNPTACGTDYAMPYQAGDGNCYHGAESVATFDLSSLNLTVPEQFIYGISYNTETWGYAPLGYDGPVDSLNVGLQQGGDPSVGSDDGTSVFYVAGPVNSNVFQRSTDTQNVSSISGYRAQVDFAETPEPSTFALMGLAAAALAGARLRKRK